MDAATRELMIVGASDRMLSAPDLKYEPPQKKIYHFYPWVAALVAGDPYAQITLCHRTSAFFAKRPPQTVEELAKTYAEVFTGYRCEIAEAKHLKPLGLDALSLLDRNRDIPPDQVNALKLDLQGSVLDVETIIAGIDATGPHIFVVTDPGIAECHDLPAFAAIGIGKQHATSQFMLARYTRFEDWRKALLLTFIAKKRAEVSPTVGPVTDLFCINLDRRTHAAQFFDLPIGFHDEFQTVYNTLEDQIAWLTQQAFHDAGAFVDTEIRRLAQPLPESSASVPAPPPDEAPAAAPEASQRSPKKKRPRKLAADKPEASS